MASAHITCGPAGAKATNLNYCPAGVPRDFAAQAAGEEIAAVDA